MDRSNQFERTTRDIINAFLEVLEQKSFDKISVQDIAGAARITRSTFYQHFPDKYAILDELCQTCMTEFAEIMKRIQTMQDKTFKENDRIMEVTHNSGLLFEWNRDAGCLLRSCKLLLRQAYAHMALL